MNDNPLAADLTVDTRRQMLAKVEVHVQERCDLCRGCSVACRECERVALDIVISLTGRAED